MKPGLLINIVLLFSSFIFTPFAFAESRDYILGTKDILKEERRDNEKGLEGDYILGIGDVLEISVWGHSDLSRQVLIRPDGKISLPLLDEIKAEGLTPSQLDKEITGIISQHIPEPKITVIVMEIKSKKIYILGQIAKPGVYPLYGKMTVLEALSMAGGPLNSADLRKGVIMRENDKSLPIDFYKLMILGDIKQNVILKPNDAIFLPSIGL